MMSRFDRRGFLGATGVALAFGACPLRLQALASGVPDGQTAVRGTWGDDWRIDDMWSPLPRPTACIGIGRRAGHCVVDVAAIDCQFGV